MRIAQKLKKQLKQVKNNKIRKAKPFISQKKKNTWQNVEKLKR